VPTEYFGKWETDSVQITVRTKSPDGKFVFVSGKTRVIITIDADRKISGQIGTASWTNAKIEPNRGLPTKMTGIEATADFATTGLFFPGDPLPEKQIGLWFLPFDENLKAEVRYTSGMAHFPMGNLQFRKITD